MPGSCANHTCNFHICYMSMSKSMSQPNRCLHIFFLLLQLSLPWINRTTNALLVYRAKAMPWSKRCNATYLIYVSLRLCKYRSKVVPQVANKPLHQNNFCLRWQVLLCRSAARQSSKKLHFGHWIPCPLTSHLGHSTVCKMLAMFGNFIRFVSFEQRATVCSAARIVAARWLSTAYGTITNWNECICCTAEGNPFTNPTFALRLHPIREYDCSQFHTDVEVVDNFHNKTARERMEYKNKYIL